VCYNLLASVYGELNNWHVVASNPHTLFLTFCIESVESPGAKAALLLYL